MLLKSLLEQERALIKVSDRKYELQDFSNRFSEIYKVARNAEEKEVNDERMGILAIVAGVLTALAAAVFALRWAYRKIPLVTTRLKSVAGSAAEGVTKMQIRHIARDEIVRQSARQALAESSEGEIAALRSQIKQAVDNENYELAGTLNSILKRLEG